MARSRKKQPSGERLVARRLDRCGEKPCAITRAPAGFKLATDKKFTYTSGSAKDACRITSRRCPVQLVFVKGRLTLRLCDTGRKGALKRAVARDLVVKSPREAQRTAAEACACWKRSGSMSDCTTSRPRVGRLRPSRLANE